MVINQEQIKVLEASNDVVKIILIDKEVVDVSETREIIQRDIGPAEEIVSNYMFYDKYIIRFESDIEIYGEDAVVKIGMFGSIVEPETVDCET